MKSINPKSVRNVLKKTITNKWVVEFVVESAAVLWHSYRLQCTGHIDPTELFITISLSILLKELAVKIGDQKWSDE